MKHLQPGMSGMCPLGVHCGGLCRGCLRSARGMAVHGAARSGAARHRRHRKLSSRREKIANPSLLGAVPVRFWALRARFALRGKGTFGQGHLGHKTAHLEVMPQAGAIFCGVLPKLAVLESHSSMPYAEEKIVPEVPRAFEDQKADQVVATAGRR